ncbi:MAG: translation elongation factor 4 [Actinomycetota bacterium]|nr:translation elongation factor 4 [Actinomycetota bacterium]
MDSQCIRNFCIVAHIDHGKSTLADRFLEITGVIEPGSPPQFLDKMELERERGITIKDQAVRLEYNHGGIGYQLNLIDPPGHVDFTYEVSRALAACEGAILLVDAAQGVQAQTIGNLNLARDAGLVIIPVVNKIDLPTGDPYGVRDEIVGILGVNPDDVLFCSAKTGDGVETILKRTIEKIPPPEEFDDDVLRALVFDSTYDSYKGVITFVRVISGVLQKGMQIELMETGTKAQVESIGYFSPDMIPIDELHKGEVGFVATGIKDVSKIPVGDTVTDASDRAEKPLPGYRAPKPFVFAGLYPVDNDEYQQLRQALAKLRLNDSAFTYEPESSAALGFGFRCGFLGVLHMEITRERLEREYGLELIVTTPNVVYRVTDREGKTFMVENPSLMPASKMVSKVEEPYVSMVILTPIAQLGSVMDLCRKSRFIHKGIDYLSSSRVEVSCEMPLAELVKGFYDQLKSSTRGFASLDYEVVGFYSSDLVKLEILVHGEPVDALSTVVSRKDARRKGQNIVSKLRKVIPRQLFDVAIQAAVDGRVVVRETIPARRKDVTAKCYGGDVTRKRKLVEKQKVGKKRMKMLGKVELPQEAFISVLGEDDKSG